MAVKRVIKMRKPVARKAGRAMETKKGERGYSRRKQKERLRRLIRGRGDE